MVRASFEAEKLGYPSASLICEGFVGQAASTAAGLGMPNLPVSMIPGHVDMQTKGELQRNVRDVTLRAVVKALTEKPEAVKAVREPQAREIVFTGTFDEVNRYFYENHWSDGLPIVPPTVEKVEEFLKYTDRYPDEVLGVLLPDSRVLTVWNVAVNGVMAGCRPEYMPILVALGEAMADPHYGVEHSGNTPGSETLITLNGRIIKQLGFNYTQGVLRDGIQPNTSIGRFWRLLLRNVAGFLPHETDKGTYGGTWKVVLAENEDVQREIGWPSTAVDQGFGAEDNVVTVSRHTGGDLLCSAFGNTPETILPYIADGVAKQIGWQMIFTVTPDMGCTQKPHILLTPVLAQTIAKAGWSKKDVQRYLYEHARLPAWKVEQYVGEWTNFVPGRRTLCDLVQKDGIPKVFCESDDPNRMVPIVCSPDDFLISVTGDPLRTNAYVFMSNGVLGYTTSKKIELPERWETLLAEAQR